MFTDATNGCDFTAVAVDDAKGSTPADDSLCCTPEIPLSADEADFEFANPKAETKNLGVADARALIRARACAIMERYPAGCACDRSASKLCIACDRFFRAAKLVLALDGVKAAKAAADADDEEDGEEPEQYDGKWAAEHIAKLNRKGKAGGKKK